MRAIPAGCARPGRQAALIPRPRVALRQGQPGASPFFSRRVPSPGPRIRAGNVAITYEFHCWFVDDRCRVQFPRGASRINWPFQPVPVGSGPPSFGATESLKQQQGPASRGDHSRSLAHGKAATIQLDCAVNLSNYRTTSKIPACGCANQAIREVIYFSIFGRLLLD